MAKPRKPIPKSQLTLSRNKHSAFKGIDEQGIQTNPNDANIPNNPNYSETGIQHNRSSQMSFKDDATKQFSVGVKDIDEALFYYFNNVLKPQVTQNGKTINVPLVYASPERWAAMQKDGYYRDKNGKTMVPLVMFKRSSFEKDNTIGNKLDGNKVHNVEYFETRYSRRNNYDNFSVLQNQLPQREYILGVIPDYLTINYEMSIFTDFTEQMNEITEAIEFSARSYWGDPEKFMFRADIKTFNTPTLLESGVDRANKTDMTLIVNAYIIPKTINVSMAGPSPKAYNIVKTVFGEQII